MKVSRIGILVVLGVMLALLGAVFIESPGYMDADYYFATGRELAAGRGFFEPFIWTYISDPSGIPGPSHLYWMPLTSIVSATSMAIQGLSFRSAQLPFLILFALLPAAVAHMSLKLHGDQDDAFRSGLLAAFPGFFFPYFLTTDMFILYAWIGLGIFWLIRVERGSKLWQGLGMGLLVGLAHLARADGWLLSAPALIGIFSQRNKRFQQIPLLLVGYAIVMGPWFLRNLSVVGFPLPPGTSRTLWLTSYPELFRYPPDTISIRSWMEAGWGQALRVRADALAVNLERILAENGLIFLGPFMLWGGLKLRRQPEIKAAFAYGLLLFLIMTLVFPFAGTHGGVFHSSSALMPILWCLAPIGLDQAVGLAAARRGWEPRRAKSLFKNSAVVLAALLTLTLAAGRVIGRDLGNPRWNDSQADYQAVGVLLPINSQGHSLTIVNNPPGFFVATGLPAVVLPEGGLVALKAVVQRFGAGWVILDRNTTMDLRSLYDGTFQPAWLVRWAEIEDSSSEPIIIYRVNQDALQ